ncbi:MAG: hypothetical protein DRJ61_19450, partial [Acidobacteria bacterium]
MPLPVSYSPYTTSSSNYGAVDSSVDQYQGLNWKAAAAVGRTLGYDPLEQYANEQAEKNYLAAQQYQAEGPEQFTDIDTTQGMGNTLEQTGQWLKNTAIQQIPQMGAMVTGGLVGSLAGPAGTLAGAAAATAPSHLGEAYQRQQETGMGTTEGMWGGAMVNTGLDLLAPAKMLKLAAKGGAQASLSKAFLKGAASEGVTEGTQYGVTEYQAGIAPNTEQKYIDGLINNAAAGAAMGAGMSSGAHVAGAPAGAMNDMDIGQQYDNLKAGVSNRFQNMEEDGLAGQSPEQIRMSTGMDALVNETPIENTQDTGGDMNIEQEIAQYIEQVAYPDVKAFMEGRLTFDQLNEPEQQQYISLDNQAREMMQQARKRDNRPSVTEENIKSFHSRMNSEEGQDNAEANMMYDPAPQYFLTDAQQTKSVDKARRKMDFGDPNASMWFDERFTNVGDFKNKKVGDRNNVDVKLARLNDPEAPGADRGEYVKVPMLS